MAGVCGVAERPVESEQGGAPAAQREYHTLGTDGRVLLRGKKSADVGRTHRVENLRRAVVLSAMA